MNERILSPQLLKLVQAAGPGYSQANPEWVKKFAELIVAECIKELRYEVLDTQECREDKSTDYKVGWEDGMFDASETIKRHFGVK